MGKENLYKRGDTYYLRYRVNGKLIRQSLEVSTLKEAEKKRKDILSSARDVKIETDVVTKVARAKNLYNPKRFKIGCVVKTFESHPALAKPSEQTMKYYKNWISSFISWVGNNHPEKLYLSDIDMETSQEYSKYIYERGITNKTFNEHINTLARVFDLLKEEAGVIRNPFAKDIIARLAKNPVSRKEFSKEQIIGILNSFLEIKDVPFKSEYELLFLLGVYTGARLKDSCLLKWEDVIFSQNIIAITPYKTRRYGVKIHIPINNWLLSKLIEAKDIGEYVLPNIAELYLKSPYIVLRIIQKVFIYNGFSNPRDNLTKHRQHSPSLYSYHSLRYCFVSFCAEAGIPMALVQDIVGHLNPSMTKHYTRFSNEFKQKEIQKLQIYLPEAKENSLRQQTIELLKSASDPLVSQVYDLLNKTSSNQESRISS